MSKSWRVIDIVTATVLAVASGLLFAVWNQIGGPAFELIDKTTPGLGGLITGIWLIGGVLGALVIRKPFAAIYVELLAAVVSAVLGSQWGITTLASGVAQGLGVELVFLLFAYRRFSLPVAVLSGVGAGWGAFILELFLTPNLPKGIGYNAIYLVSLSVSGAALAGALGFFLVRGLAATGALDRFAVSR